MWQNLILNILKIQESKITKISFQRIIYRVFFIMSNNELTPNKLLSVKAQFSEW